MWGVNPLFAEDIPESSDSILRIFDELDLGLIAYVLIEGSVKEEDPQKNLVYHFFSVERDGTRNLTFAIFISDALCKPFLDSRISNRKKKSEWRWRTFVKTAIDA